MSSVKWQAIFWISAGLLSIEYRGIDLSGFWNKFQQLANKEMDLKMLSAKCLPFCLGINM